MPWSTMIAPMNRKMMELKYTEEISASGVMPKRGYVTMGRRQVTGRGTTWHSHQVVIQTTWPSISCAFG